MNGLSGPVVLINVFEVPPDGDDTFVESWERARDLLRTQPGYLSTALHQALTPQANFTWVNIARWASPAAFGAAMGHLAASGVSVPYPAHPALYEVVRADEPAGDLSTAVTLINPFEVPVGGDEVFLAGWEGARDYLRMQEGYLGTRLHRSLSAEADFRFINVGWYASPQAFQAAISSPGFQDTARRLPYRAHPGLYRVARQ